MLAIATFERVKARTQTNENTAKANEFMKKIFMYFTILCGGDNIVYSFT